MPLSIIQNEEVIFRTTKHEKRAISQIRYIFIDPLKVHSRLRKCHRHDCCGWQFFSSLHKRQRFVHLSSIEVLKNVCEDTFYNINHWRLNSWFTPCFAGYWFTEYKMYMKLFTNTCSKNYKSKVSLACSRRSDGGVRREGRERENMRCPHDLNAWNRLRCHCQWSLERWCHCDDFCKAFTLVVHRTFTVHRTPWLRTYFFVLPLKISKNCIHLRPPSNKLFPLRSYPWRIWVYP